MTEGAANGPLAGIRVVDITGTIVGPCATQILGDLGADVIKVEPPGGDQLRNLGPARNPGMASMFLGLNRNKRSVLLDLKTGDGRKVLHKLLEGADVLVHNMRIGAAQRLGISYEALAPAHPKLVYASASGYRTDGALADQPAFDEVIQGASGISALFQRAGDNARYAPFTIADKVIGYMLASAIGMALFERSRSGRGQAVQVPMLEAMVDFNVMEHYWGHAFDPPLAPPGYTRIFTPERKPFRTKDGHVCVTATTDAQWARLFAAVDRPELAKDPRFEKMAQRSFHFAAAFAELEQALLARTTAEWIAIFNAADLPNGPAPTLDELFEDPYLKAGGLFRRYEHPSEGTLVTSDSPVKYSRTPAAMRRPPPRLGEHTQEVLRELGFDEAFVGRMSGAARPG